MCVFCVRACTWACVVHVQIREDLFSRSCDISFVIHKSNNSFRLLRQNELSTANAFSKIGVKVMAAASRCPLSPQGAEVVDESRWSGTFQKNLPPPYFHSTERHLD